MAAAPHQPHERRCEGCGEPNPAGNLLCRACGARLDSPRAGPPGGQAGPPGGEAGPRAGQAAGLVQLRRKGTTPPPASRPLPVAATPEQPLLSLDGPPAGEGSLRPIAWGWLGLSVAAPFMLATALVLLLGRSSLLANIGAALGLVAGAALVNLLRGPGAQLLEPVLGTVTVYIVAAVVTASWRDAGAAKVPLVVHLFMVLLVGALGYGGGWLGRWARTRARSST